MNINEVLVVGGTVVGLLLVMIAKNEYAAKRCHEAVDIISAYANSLINNRTFDESFEYFDEMLVNYYVYVFNPFAFGKYKAIKKEYRQLLKDFDKTK